MKHRIGVLALGAVGCIAIGCIAQLAPECTPLYAFLIGATACITAAISTIN